VLGVTQTEPKAVLAYSSVSQMGFMTVAVGAGWASPTADAARAAVSLFALHHAFAKGALLLGVGVFQKAAGRASRWVMCGLVLGALEIAGGPFTGGAFAKAELSALIHTLPAGSTLLSWGISCAAIGSTLLMLRFLQRLSAGAAPQRERPGPSLWLPWALLLVFDLTLQLRTTEKGLAASVLSQPAKLWAASWPILAGVIVAWAAQRARVRLPAIPEGDVLVWIERGLRGVRTPALHASDWLRGQAARIGTSFRHQRARVGRTLVAWGLQGEARLRSFEIVGTLLLGLLALLLLR
jgi:NADH:ubiquinone oxidoreductase subunit 5 (subunit L)/multisubunit Na+/H+ antiporter MnhA subunit